MSLNLNRNNLLQKKKKIRDAKSAPIGFHLRESVEKYAPSNGILKTIYATFTNASVIW